jgi:HPr kinase/phosphorylase
MTLQTATVHASAVLTGNRAILIRGPAGTGKTRLALALLDAATSGRLAFARLVGDDRIELAVHHGRLLVRPAPALAGLVEIRGMGIRRIDHEPVAVAGWIVDLGALDAERMPSDAARTTDIDGIRLPRLPVATGADALAGVLAMLRFETK